MDAIRVSGGRALRGTVRASGAKNAALPILAASLLTEEAVIVENVPDVRDVRTMARILETLGATVEREGDRVTARVSNIEADTAPYDLVKTIRGSFYVLGPLVARRGRGRVSMPGGCVLGTRPVDLHEKALRGLGAHVELQQGYVEARARRLRGAELFLGSSFGSTVGGTCLALMAATLAEGTTVLEGAAEEPEVGDLARCLVTMGARIKGIGTHRLVIEGVERLHGTTFRILPDRIESGTFLLAGAITRGEVTVEGMRPDHLGAFFDKLADCGVRFERGGDWARVLPGERPHATALATLPYPGFPTDLQAPFLVLLAVASGISVVHEKIYPDRFMHVPELARLGASIRKEGAHVILEGVDHLSGAPVMASDLRACAALVLAGLVARGETRVQRVYHLDRGYEGFEEKLRGLGADIDRVSDPLPSSQVADILG